MELGIKQSDLKYHRLAKKQARDKMGYWQCIKCKELKSGVKPKHVSCIECRTKEALKLRQQGLSNDEIAQRMKVAKGTAINYLLRSNLARFGLDIK